MEKMQYSNIFVVADDSFSMELVGGKLLNGKCGTRLEEQAETLRILNKESLFGNVYYLNKPNPINLLNFSEIIENNKAIGMTPLCATIRRIILDMNKILSNKKENNGKIQENIENIKSLNELNESLIGDTIEENKDCIEENISKIIELEKNNATLSTELQQEDNFLLVIITDGQASDGDLKLAMDGLKGLPVKIILRLVTNDDNIVSYWDNIDKYLKLDMDVIDDYINKVNILKITC